MGAEHFKELKDLIRRMRAIEKSELTLQLAYSFTTSFFSYQASSWACS